MEFAVNWIMFSAIAIAIGSSIETRKLSNEKKNHLHSEEKKKVLKTLKFIFDVYIYLVDILTALKFDFY